MGSARQTDPLLSQEVEASEQDGESDRQSHRNGVARPFAMLDEGSLIYVKKITRYYARMLLRRDGLSELDPEDIQQDLYVDVFKRLPEFDPAKASIKTFVDRIVRHHAAEIFKRHKYYKRAGPSLVSVDDVLKERDGEMLTRAETIRERKPEKTELRLDVEAVMAKLPPMLRAYCKWLIACNGNISAAAREMKLSRATLCKTVLPALRAAFETIATENFLRESARNRDQHSNSKGMYEVGAHSKRSARNNAQRQPHIDNRIDTQNS